MSSMTRRDFLAGTAVAALASAVGPHQCGAAQEQKGADIRYGLVTYQWGNSWDLPTLIKNCERAEVWGVELRTTHKHGVEPTLTAAERDQVRALFDATKVQLVGLGSNERFDNPDPRVVEQAIEATEAFIRLSHDVGGTGVKVKPDSFHKAVPREKTIRQIGQSLNQVAEYGEKFGQQIRLEVHGECCQLPTIRAILDVADHPNVYVCWNSNAQDLEAPGLEHNFNLVQGRLGPTTHVRRFDNPKYPWAQLLDLFVKADYSGWMMLEEGEVPQDPATELISQRELFDKMLAEARKRSG